MTPGALNYFQERWRVCRKTIRYLSCDWQSIGTSSGLSHATLQQAECQCPTWSSDAARDVIRINDVQGRVAVDGGGMEAKEAAEGGFA